MQLMEDAGHININTFFKIFSRIFKINNGVFDMGVGQLTITKDRRILVEFSINMFYREVGFGGSLAQRVDAFNTLILPFDTSIWLALLVSIATYFALLVVSEFVMGYTQKQSDQIFTSFCLTVFPLLNDSVPSRMHSQNRYTARWFSLTLWLLLGVMLSMAYKSNLLATLTIVKIENPINSPEELLNTGYPVYSLAGTVLSEGLQSSPMAIYRQIYQESVLDKKSLLIFGASWDSANEEIRNGKAFKATTKFDALADPTIRFLPDPFFIGSSGWFFMKGSVIEKQISAECRRLIEAGLLDHWEGDYIKKKKQDNTAFYETLAPIHAVQPITVIHFLPIVLSCSIGYALSLLSFSFELLFGKNQSWVAALKQKYF
ncbi:hypothetical protein TCAL_14626 [Tigriopus californicus]|uniref:Ionotropic glutamate receptor C-terminal domain-containing protein n=1 Tax=Tigriopus californicus TaxID=6832 RepID=A0A553P8D1_TIGCA|nr:hypothetical protein TCAL_14626 [Tigriopus californicus]